MEKRLNTNCNAINAGVSKKSKSGRYEIVLLLLMVLTICVSFAGCADAQATTDLISEFVTIENPSNVTETQIPEEADAMAELDAEETVPNETETAVTETVHIHSYTSKVTNPSCTEAGYTTFTCDCGNAYIAEHTDPTGHDYSSQVKAPTCTEKGFTTYICRMCNDTYTADQTDANGHNYCQKVTNPTCIDKGYTTYTCSICGDSYTSNKTNATGHSWDNWNVTKEPTTTAEGTEQRTCKTCSKTDSRSIAKLPEETEPAYETFSGAIGNYNAYNLAYKDWKGDTEQAAFIEVYSVEKNDDVLNALATEFHKVYGFAPSLDDESRCSYGCEMMGTYMVDGYPEPHSVYHYTITDKTYIYISNAMYEVYVQQCADGSVWVGYCIYATMDSISEERSKAEVQALDQQMYAIFEELIGFSRSEMEAHKEKLELKIGYISEAGVVRSPYSSKPANVLYVYCRGFPYNDSDA